MGADVLLMPLGGRVVDAPAAGTVLVVGTPDGWRVTLRGFTWGARMIVPRYGAGRGVGVTDGMAAAEAYAERHGAGIQWRETGPRSLIATGVWTR